MDIELWNKLGSIFFILAGLHLIRNYRKLGREVAESQRDKMLPFKKATPKELSVCYLVGGIISTLVGALSLLGIISFKR